MKFAKYLNSAVDQLLLQEGGIAGFSLQERNILERYDKLSFDLGPYVHAFEELDYMLQALKSNEFGRDRFTSIGNLKSKITKNYQNQLWIDKPNGVKPVLYLSEEYSRTDPPLEITKIIKNHEGIQSFLHQKEQEWYIESKLKITKIRAIIYSEYTTQMQIELIKRHAKSTAIFDYKQFREANYDIKKLMS